MKTQTDRPVLLLLVGVLSVVGLESYALSQHVDGVALSASIAAIAGIVGITVGRIMK